MNNIKCDLIPFKEGMKLIDNIGNQKDSTVYQGKEFLSLYWQSQVFRIIGLKPEVNILHKEFFFIEVRDGKELCCLMPCEYDKRKRTIGLAGDQKQLNVPYYNAERFTYKMFEEMMTVLRNCRKCEVLRFVNLDHQTLFYNYLVEYCKCAGEGTVTRRTRECVSIEGIDSNYDKWFKGLSKSVRQNVRTSYNHLKSDGIEMDVRHYLGGAKLSIIRRDMYLQRRRNLEKRGYIEMNWKKKLLCWVGSWMSLLNPRTKMLMKSNKSYLCEIWLDGTLAAFVGGYLSCQGRFFIPFLKYNMNFKRYSPGGLAICESIKYLCESDYNLKRYDLLTGDEPYKYSYGGTAYENTDITIKI